MKSRLEKCKNKMREKELDAMLVSSPANCFYFTNFDKPNLEFRSIWLFITQNTNYVFTNPLHIVAVRGHFKGREDEGPAYHPPAGGRPSLFEVVEMTSEKSLPDLIRDLCKKEVVGRLGIEAKNLKVDEFQKFKSTQRSSGSFDNLVEADDILSELRMIKEEREVKNIIKAQKITDKAYKYILGFIKPGMAELQIALEIEYFMRKNGADEKSFDPIIASGQNSAIPHHKSSNRKIKKGDILLLDFGCRVNGYCSDMTRVVLVAKPRSKNGFTDAFNAVLKAQETALKCIKPGITCNDADALARDYLKKEKLDKYFTHTLGHNLGLGIHEPPRLGPGSNKVLKEGMVFSVEPGIYIDGKYGIRIEDIVFLQKDGIVNLTKSPKKLIVI